MSPRANDSRALSVLVVDDIQDVADSLAAVLRLEGYNVHTAYDANAALLIAQAVPLDVAIFDIAMPQCSGYELAARFRSSLLAAPLFIAVTGFTGEEYRERSLREGFREHFIKPVPLDELFSLLAEFAASKRP